MSKGTRRSREILLILKRARKTTLLGRTELGGVDVHELDHAVEGLLMAAWDAGYVAGHDDGFDDGVCK